MMTQPTPASPAFDTTRRFVRITGERANGFIEFDFSIGEPDLSVEMILGRDALAEFCAANRVEMLPPPTGEARTARNDAADAFDWRLANATHIRFR
jgi:phenol/toluene 2-monooxygenase (NADH) P0/A0